MKSISVSAGRRFTVHRASSARDPRGNNKKEKRRREQRPKRDKMYPATRVTKRTSEEMAVIREASRRRPCLARLLARESMGLGDWHNLFNTFLARWGHRRTKDASTSGVTTGLRCTRGSLPPAIRLPPIPSRPVRFWPPWRTPLSV